MKLFDGYEDSLPLDGEYDMRRDTTGMPKTLANKINSHICFKGGGGGQTTVTKSGIDDEFKPYLEKVLKDVTGRYETEVAGGPDSIVAAMTPEQEASLKAQEEVANNKMAGTGAYDMRAANMRDLKNLQGRGNAKAATGGYGGSARSQMAMNSVLANRSSEQQRERQSTREAGVGDLGKVGTVRQKYAQERLDAPHTSAQRYFGYLSGAPQQSEKTGGGGGK
jgi:hypothetical protein